jgi:hypothetical protein
MTRQMPSGVFGTIQSRSKLRGLHVCVLSRFDDDGTPLIVVADGLEARQRRAGTVVALDHKDLGREVAVSFGDGSQADPVILGPIASRARPAAPLPPTLTVDSTPVPLEITAERELVLRCGKASITLTREGKIILRGTYISSRSSGANRIKGGSVQIN